jgi:hypothetical protein
VNDICFVRISTQIIEKIIEDQQLYDIINPYIKELVVGLVDVLRADNGRFRYILHKRVMCYSKKDIQRLKKIKRLLRDDEVKNLLVECIEMLDALMLKEEESDNYISYNKYYDVDEKAKKVHAVIHQKDVPLCVDDEERSDRYYDYKRELSWCLNECGMIYSFGSHEDVDFIFGVKDDDCKIPFLLSVAEKNDPEAICELGRYYYVLVQRELENSGV